MMRLNSPAILAIALVILASPAATQQATDTAGFRVAYLPAAAEHAELADLLREHAVFTELAETIVENVRLPRSVSVKFMECGEENAFYDPGEPEIRICYELIASLSNGVFSEIEDDSLHGAAVLNATMFILLHEIGHALVGELRLPVGIGEENQVDAIAVYLLLDESDAEKAGNAEPTVAIDTLDVDSNDALQAVIDGAVALRGGADEFDDSDFADVHGLGPQRFFNIVCWAYGARPDDRAELARELGLPQERMDTCPEDYQRLAQSVRQWLAPHIRE